MGLPGAVLLGLGSIVGTGVFVSLGIAAGVTGPSVILALGIAGILAALNGVSSAQLAAAYPVSGGTYEYAYRTLGPGWGFTAGFMFMAAKSASAATATLGLAGYLLGVTRLHAGWQTPLALLGLAGVVALVLAGLRRTNFVNTLLVGFTLLVLFGLAFVASRQLDPANFRPAFPEGPVGLLHASALMFVAYTGYGRIATLGEEVIDPEKTIPRAIFVTLGVVMALYATVGVAAVGVLGAPAMAAITASHANPLAALAEAVGGVPGSIFLSAAAITAMAGVLLNLVLGLSRVLLAMGRRGDVPSILATVNDAGTTPGPAVLMVGILIGLLCLAGDVRTTWSFSAFTVLVYYALTNAAAWHLPRELRRAPRILSAMGLVGCLALSIWIEVRFMIAGLGLLVLGHGMRWGFKRLGSRIL